MLALSGRVAVVTGGSRGLGAAVVDEFRRQGAEVHACARKPNRGQYVVDVSKPDDVDEWERELLSVCDHIDVLVCNAGVIGSKGRLNDVDWGDWRQTIEVNLFGAVLCCKYFLSLLRRSPRGKIILISGGGATKPMPYLSAYAASKAALVRFGETLAEELRGEIDVNMVSPGTLNTSMLDEAIAAGPGKVGSEYYEYALDQKATCGSSIQEAVNLCAYLASSESDGITGKLISAVWDDWRNLKLDNADSYTLRRMVPA